jgi:hypothetical protein
MPAQIIHVNNDEIGGILGEGKHCQKWQDKERT